jgi:hypothetical protein
MKRETVWVWVSIGSLIFGALLSIASSLPYHVAFTDVRSFVGPAVVAVAYVLWLAEAQPRDLYFGIVFGGTAALIDKDKILIGLIGLALVCIARTIQFKVEKK